MSIYRFKTESEFKKDNLWNDLENCPQCWNSSGEMNHYMGQNISDEFNAIISKGSSFSTNNWSFRSVDCILIKDYSLKRTSSVHYKPGDVVKIIITDVTEEEWKRIGKLTVSIKKGDIKVIKEYSPYNNSVFFEDEKGWYPSFVCEKLNKKLESMENYKPGDLVECISIECDEEYWRNVGKVPIRFSVGQTFTIKEVREHSLYFEDRIEGNRFCYPKILFKKIDKKKQDLLNQAKILYPIGIKFTPSHVEAKSKICIVTNNKFLLEEASSGLIIYSLTDENKTFSSDSKYGNNSYNRLVYNKGKWADIVDDTEEKSLKIKKLKEKIIRDYPIGTIFYCAINNLVEEEMTQYYLDNLRFTDDFETIDCLGKRWILKSGKWATIKKDFFINKKIIFLKNSFSPHHNRGDIVEIIQEDSTFIKTEKYGWISKERFASKDIQLHDDWVKESVFASKESISSIVGSPFYAENTETELTKKISTDQIVTPKRRGIVLENPINVKSRVKL